MKVTTRRKRGTAAWALGAVTGVALLAGCASAATAGTDAAHVSKSAKPSAAPAAPTASPSATATASASATPTTPSCATPVPVATASATPVPVASASASPVPRPTASASAVAAPASGNALGDAGPGSHRHRDVRPEPGQPERVRHGLAVPDGGAAVGQPDHARHGAVAGGLPVAVADRTGVAASPLPTGGVARCLSAPRFLLLSGGRRGAL